MWFVAHGQLTDYNCSKLKWNFDKDFWWKTKEIYTESLFAFPISEIIQPKVERLVVWQPKLSNSRTGI